MNDLLKRILALGLSATMLLSGAAFAQDDEEQEEEGPVVVNTIVQEYEGRKITLSTVDLDFITVDGYQFKDLNKDGELQPYEDWRLTGKERAQNLISLMDGNQMAAQMAHVTLVTLKESWFSSLDIGFALAYTYFGEGKEFAAEKINYIQALCEQSDLAIPVVFSMDSVIGASWINGTTIMPDAITLGAAGDVDLVNRVADAQREEMLALNIRMSLSPNADLATDPRWGRNQETYGEDPEMATNMVIAAVTGLQNGTEGLKDDSVMACVKHFPGSGPQTAGVDGTPLVFDDETFALHTNIFKAAMEVNPASIMPYGYSTVPYLGGDAVEKYAHESYTVTTEILREQMGYDGIIQTDWGLSAISEVLAGADVVGGMGTRDIKKVLDQVSVDTLSERVARLLQAKFELGVFENPYADVETVKAVVGSEKNYQLAMEAAQKAATLVKYENIKPLEEQNVIVAGEMAKDVDALSSGWKLSTEKGLIAEGKSILEGIEKRSGKNVTYVATAADVAAAYPENTTAIVIVGEKSGTHEPAWGTANIEFPAEQVELVTALKNAGVKVVSVVLMNRAYVMTPIAEASDAVMIVYRPGVTAGAEAVAHVLYGDCAVTGKLPWQIPATAEQVYNQREDLPKDIENPLYDFGFGIELSAFGKE